MCFPTTLTAVRCAQVGQLLHALIPHANNIPIVVRVSFVLGNVTASELSSRQELSAAGGKTTALKHEHGPMLLVATNHLKQLSSVSVI